MKALHIAFFPFIILAYLFIMLLLIVFYGVKVIVDCVASEIVTAFDNLSRKIGLSPNDRL